MNNLKKTIFYCLFLPFIFHLITFLIYKKMKKGALFMKDFNMFVKKRKFQGGDCLCFVKLMTLFPEFRSIFYWRLGKIAKLVFFYMPGRTNLELYTPSNRVGGGFFVGHGWGTVVNADCIGENFNVGQNCTIGSRNGGLPKIGNNVSCWAGTIVIGDVTIGDYTEIGSGAVVVKSVPSNAVVVPTKSKIIRIDNQRVDIPL